MPRIVVHVMPKPEILDPQGKAISAALRRLNIEGFDSVRQGKRFELEYEGDATQEILDKAKEAAITLLSNPVIEDVVSVSFAQDDASTQADPSTAGASAAGSRA